MHKARHFALDLKKEYSVVNDRRIETRHRPVSGRPPSRGDVKLAAPSAAENVYVVELIGIEPTTSGLQSPRSPS